jgi:hypothetical protein
VPPADDHDVHRMGSGLHVVQCCMV